MTPKERFQTATEAVKAWNEITDGNLFMLASSHTLLEVTTRLASKPGAVYDAQSRAHMIAGAIMALETLKDLGRVKLPPAGPEEQTLEYEQHAVQPGLRPQKPSEMPGDEGEGLR